MSSVETRQIEIQKLLHQQGTLRVPDLAQQFHASLDTIRRDLRQMEENGLLRRIHGGAVQVSVSNGPYQSRLLELLPEKGEIARKVARDLIPNDAIVFFDSGSTILEIARHLKPSFCGMVITVNPAVAVTLAEHPNAKIIMIGGPVLKQEMAIHGPTAMDEIRRYHADICIIGTCALHPEQGLTASCLEERTTKAAMIAQSTEAIAVATADKLETSLPHRVCGLDEISRLVTGRKLSSGYLQNYKNHGVEIILA
ncbi:MAG: DeoR/GlpR family DNA-binding transcription regulator [Pseudomonadota bacterium]